MNRKKYQKIKKASKKASKKNQRLLDKDCKAFVLSRMGKIMKQNTAKKINLESLSFEEIQRIKNNLAEAEKKVAGKMSEAEKQSRLKGYDEKIKSLYSELRLQKSLRYKLAKSLGIIQTETTDRNNKTSLYRFAVIYGKGNKSLSFTVYTDETKGKAIIPVTFKKVGKKVEKVITKADRKKAFEKIATDIGLSISEKAYNNHSCNIWLPQLIGTVAEKNIRVEKKAL